MQKAFKYIVFLIILFMSTRVYATSIDGFQISAYDGDDKFSFVGASDKTSGAKVTDTRFSLADYGLVTSIKNQSNTSACWAFASNSSIESNMLVKSLGNTDLSEAHMELATLKEFANNRNTFNRNKNTGGNYLVSSAYAMNLWGPIKEETMPFDVLLNHYNNGTKVYASDIVNQKATVDVNSIVFLGNSGPCSSSTIEDIKEYLITNGAMAANIYLAANKKNDSYLYYNGSENVNHGISIIGWNDSISVSLFDDSPSRNGAWIIKNSYGGNNYQYVSYDDIHICNTVAGFFDTETNVEDNAYYYDNLGINTLKTASDKTVYFKSVFKKKNPNSSEELKEVSMYFAKINQNFEVYFADDNVSNVHDMIKVASGTSDFIGYKTVKINSQRINSDYFTIIIKITDNQNVVYEVSSKADKISNYNTIKFLSDVQYISSDGINYNDVTKVSDGPYHVPVRAYTNTIKNPLPVVNNNNNNTNKTSSSSKKKETTNNSEGSVFKFFISAKNVGENTSNSLDDNPYTGDLNPWVVIIPVFGLTLFMTKKLKKAKIFKI